MDRMLKKIVKVLSEIQDVKAVILYGSFARKEGSLRSDIDLLILTMQKKTEKIIEEKVIGIEKDIGRTIQPTIRTLEELKKTDTGLLQNIFQEGKILYLKEPVDVPSSLILEQKPWVIYSFRLSSLNQNQKAKFNNDFYGRQKGKYNYKGLLNEVGGQKLSAGSILVAFSEKQKIEKLFRQFKVQFSQLKVWK